MPAPPTPRQVRPRARTRSDVGAAAPPAPCHRRVAGWTSRSPASPLPITAMVKGMAPPRAFVMCVAGRRSGGFEVSSLVRTPTQLRAEHESPRAQIPCTAGCEISPATVLRTGALQSKWSRFLVAYRAISVKIQHLRTDSHHRLHLLWAAGAQRSPREPHTACSEFPTG